MLSTENATLNLHGKEMMKLMMATMEGVTIKMVKWFVAKKNV